MNHDRLQCLAVSGDDREIFLQGQLTQDVSRLQASRILDAAWCNPKGRVISIVTLVHADDRIHLFLPDWQADDFTRRILRYRLRARVEIDPEPGMQVLAVSSDTGSLPSAPDTEVSARRVLSGNQPPAIEFYGTAKALESVIPYAMDDAAWELATIRAGIPCLRPDTVESFTPHMLNLDLLDAVSFRKGCYTGQEVVARTENLGRPSRRTLAFRADTDSPPAPGTQIMDGGGKNIGSVIRSAGADGLAEFLAVVSIKSLGGPLRLVSGETIRRSPLPYSVPELDVT